MILQRWDLAQRLPFGAQLPIVEQLLLVSSCPLDDQAERLRRQVAVKDGQRADIDLCAAVRVLRMKCGGE